jgi:hypothetical protein
VPACASWRGIQQRSCATGQQDLHTIREQLQVGAVLTGSVRISGGNLRVRAQLIDTASGVYLWSETFDRRMQDVFAIQEEIALAICAHCGCNSRLAKRVPLARSRSSIGSYDYYLRGRYYWHRRRPKIWRAASSISRPRSRPIHARHWPTAAWPMRTR